MRRSFFFFFHRASPSTSDLRPLLQLTFLSPQTPTHTQSTNQLPSWGYTRYANHLASWGYAAVQYDPEPYWLTIMPRGVETELFVNPVIEWALGPGAAAANTQLDARRMGVTGHSLGGKVSVLALGYSKTGSKHAGPTNISAAFLLDAVDIRIVTHEAPYFYSNMGETFANITVPIGAMGMPIRDKCTIAGHSWDIVYPSARKGSWMFLVYKSSHVVWMAAAEEAKDKINVGRLRLLHTSLKREAVSVKSIHTVMETYPELVEMLCSDFLQRTRTTGGDAAALEQAFQLLDQMKARAPVPWHVTSLPIPLLQQLLQKLQRLAGAWLRSRFTPY